MESFTWITSLRKKKSLVFDRPGKYVVFFYNISGKLVFELLSPGIVLIIRGLFVGSRDDEFFLETIQRHSGPSSTSDLLIKGVFCERSRFHYQGLIRIEKKAQKSHAYQKNQNLILSPDTFIESKPFLEILAHDVFCTHGSTTGVLNKEHVLYLESRGLTEEKGRKLLAEGFVGELVDTIKDKISAKEIEKIYEKIKL